jgi:hypothetical protein
MTKTKREDHSIINNHLASLSLKNSEVRKKSFLGKEFQRPFNHYNFRFKRKIEGYFNDELSIQFFLDTAKIIYDDGTCITTTIADPGDCIADHLPNECEFLIENQKKENQK